MTYEEYEKAYKKLLEIQALFKKVKNDKKGQRSERAAEGEWMIIKAKAIINDLYEVFEDED